MTKSDGTSRFMVVSAKGDMAECYMNNIHCYAVK